MADETNPYLQFLGNKDDNPYTQFLPQAAEPSAAAPKTRRSDEPPDLFWGPSVAAARGAGGAVKGFFERVGQAGRGEISPIGPMFEGATLAVASPVRLGLGAMTQAPKARAPIAGTMEELERAAAEVVTKPTGAVVPQAEAGGAVRRAITSDAEAGMLDVPWRVRALVKKNSPVLDENIVGHLVDMARSKVADGSKLPALGHIRQAVPVEDWAKVQGASLGYMGRTGGLGEEVGFDALKALREFRDMPEPGRSLIFGRPVTVAGQKLQAGLRPHLDSLVADYERIEKLRIPNGPLEVLAESLGIPIPPRYMAEPKTAAPIAQWSRAFTRLIEQGRSPASIGAFKIATNNLQNSLDEKLDLSKLVEALNPISSARAALNPEETEQRRVPMDLMEEHQLTRPRRPEPPEFTGPRPATPPYDLPSGGIGYVTQLNPRSIGGINRPLPEEEEARRRIRDRIEGRR
jgi:hypothetical protein